MVLNSVLISIALVIFCASLVILFAKDIAWVIKKIFFHPGLRLLAALALASWIIQIYESWGHWLLLWMQAKLHLVINKIASFLPFQSGAISIIRIVFLFCLACLPLWIYKLKAKKKGHRIPPQPFTYWLGLTLWIIAVILLSVSYS